MARKPTRVWVQAMAGRTLALQWHDPVTGKRRTQSTGTNDAAKAEELRAKKEYELRHGLHAEPSALTWESFVELYVNERLAGRREATRRKASQVLAEFSELTRVGKLADVDERAVSRYSSALRERGRQSATVAGSLAYLRAALRWAARQQLLPRAPHVEMPRLSRRVHIRVITDFEWGRIIAAAHGDWPAFLWVCWHTGMRRTEATRLRWDQHGDDPWVDLSAKRIWIPAGAAKSDSDDWLPIRKELLGILTPLAKPSGRCFSLGHVDGSKGFAKICRRAGVSGVTLHDIRRTFGTRLAPHVPAHVLQRLMRHANIATTLKYYISLDDGLADAIEKGG